MRIVLSGVETNNKGAELMLYAILQELERRYPDAEVFIDKKMIKQGLDYVKSPIKISYIPYNKVQQFCQKYKITGFLNRIGLFSDYLNNTCPIKHVDYYIDGSGLSFSDKHIKSASIAIFWRRRLNGYKKQGAKIIFLPQGFGPLEQQVTRYAVKSLVDFSDIIFAREKVSYESLFSVYGNSSNIRLSTDFTSLVDGHCPEQLKRLYGKVCIIPNVQMVNKGVLTKVKYFDILDEIISCCKAKNHDVYLLNHEGQRDVDLASEYLMERNKSIEFITGLNAIEVKGLISTAYIVISSRFHGVASSLNCHVPCLATSWHHKYAELFRDFGMEDCVLSLDNPQERQLKIEQFLDEKSNKEIRELLISKKAAIMEQNKQMWNLIWSLK